MKSATAALATAVLGIASIFLVPRLALSPGPLTSGHARIEDRCLDCHGLGAGASRDKCVACHALDRIGTRDAAAAAADNGRIASASTTILTTDTNTGARRAAIAGMHRSFTKVWCGECHTAHAGSDPAAAMRTFSHETLSTDLRRQCRSCHEAARPADDLHRAQSDECGTCHATSAWKPATFIHDKYFVLDRDHAAACRVCHDQAPGYRVYTCYGCHEHSREGMVSEHREEGVRNLDNCVRCHRSADEREGRGEGGHGDTGGERRRGRQHERERDGGDDGDDD